MSAAGPSGDMAALERVAARLEEVAGRIAGGAVPPEELRALADEALALGAEITERLPRALRAPGSSAGADGTG